MWVNVRRLKKNRNSFFDKTTFSASFAALLSLMKCQIQVCGTKILSTANHFLTDTSQLTLRVSNA